MKNSAARIIFGGVAVFCVVGIFLGVCYLPTRQCRISPTADWMKPVKSTWVLQSPGMPYSIQTDSSVKKDGDDSLRFELRKGEQWVDATFMRTFRAEIATKEFPPAGSVKWYAFSVFFPTNFPIEDNRLVFAQWKENESFFGARLIPSLAFRFVNGKFSITLRHSDGKAVNDADAVPVEDLFKKGNFHLGRWHDFVIQVKWSYKDDGFVNIWWNNKQIVEYHGPVGYNLDLAPQFKFGLYRDATDKTYVACFNQVKSGNRPQEVGFNLSTATRYSTSP